jgi:hypothetical protein
MALKPHNVSPGPCSARRPAGVRMVPQGSRRLPDSLSRAAQPPQTASSPILRPWLHSSERTRHAYPCAALRSRSMTAAPSPSSGMACTTTWS